jgi:hypothetical protein
MKLWRLVGTTIAILGMTPAAQATVLYTPWLSHTSNNYGFCFATNVDKKPHDFKVEILNAFSGAVLTSMPCNAVASLNSCYAFDYTSGLVDMICRVTTDAPKTKTRADLVVRETDGTVDAGVVAQ